jgi:hypothetical protein
MYRKYLNARSPLRLLEKGLHGGLGTGNVGALVAGAGVGKSAFLVGIATDELLRGGTVLHVTLRHTVAHAKAYYDSVYSALASSTRLEDAARTHVEIDGRRRIRAYPPGGFSVSKLAEAAKLESESGAQPSVVVIDGLDPMDLVPDGIAQLRALAGELEVEIWITLDADDDEGAHVPTLLADQSSSLAVILTAEPDGHEVALRAVKDHDNADLQNLRVALDPTTLLVVRH